MTKTNDLIDRWEALNKLNDLTPNYHSVYGKAVQHSIGVVKSLPSMGASHKHGKWIRRWKTVDGNVFRCSECGSELAVEEEEMFFDFCPYCGADMRKEPGDGQTG